MRLLNSTLGNCLKSVQDILTCAPTNEGLLIAHLRFTRMIVDNMRQEAIAKARHEQLVLAEDAAESAAGSVLGSPRE